jgi:chaperonin GroEL
VTWAKVRAAPDEVGLNALTGEFGNLLVQGVADPLRVTRLTLQHAASVAAPLLTTEAVVAEQLVARPGAVIAPGLGDLAEGLASVVAGVRLRGIRAGPRTCIGVL